MMLDANRLEKVRNVTLSKGSHKSLKEGGCLMEIVSFVAGEPWSDHPACACPVIGAFLRAWNDDLPDDKRDALLRPLVPLLVGTRSTPAVERRRAMMAADWLIREHTPAWLRLAGLTTQADALVGLPEITDMAQFPSLMPTLDAVRKDAIAAWAAARDAAKAAAGDAAWDAAWAAAWVAAWVAAGDAAWDAAMAAAWDAAGDAARGAAWAAARVAAWDAAWDALKPTAASLQQSALALVHRMIGAAS